MKLLSLLAALLLPWLLVAAEPVPAPRKLPDPTPAICALRTPGGSGSATIVAPRRADGRWDVLTAAHCIDGHPTCTLLLRDGRKLTAAVTVASHRYGRVAGRLAVVDPAATDLAWLVLDAGREAVPAATLAAADPQPGVAVWHRGFARHGLLRLDGVVRPPDDPGGSLGLVIDFEGGDSGGGVFRADTNELVGVASSTARGGEQADAWAGSASAARRLRPVK